MYTLPYAEFYITNVCNLTCQNCNRFNNYHFTGWQDWADYADIYAKWANIVDIETPVILGGEPLLNPTILDWIQGTKALWPHRHWRITTNGTRLNHVRGLYDCVRETQCWIELSLHDERQRNELTKIVRDFLINPTVTELDFGTQYLDPSGVKIVIYPQTDFTTSTVVKHKGLFNLHNSNPTKAHAICGMRECHHFIRGKLYKCGVVGILPDFATQHAFDLTESDKELMNSYQALTPVNNSAVIDDFFAQIKNPIPQCKFCPESYQTYKIHLDL
jgi:organic radical activating enzyme